MYQILESIQIDIAYEKSRVEQSNLFRINF